MTKTRIFLSLLFCIFLFSCNNVTDLSEHTAEFYLLNFSDTTLSVDFISNQKKSVLPKTSIKNIAPITESDPLLSKNWDDILAIKDNKKTGYVASTFIPGTYKVDIDGFATKEKIYPIVSKDGQKISIMNENAAYMDLRYDDNPSMIFLIMNSKLKLSINSEVYSQVLNANINNDAVKEALNTIYFQSSYPQNSPAKIKDNCSGSNPDEFIKKIRLLESIEELIDAQASYFIFQK